MSMGTDRTSSFGGDWAGLSTRLAGTGAAAAMGSDMGVEVDVDGVVLAVDVLDDWGAGVGNENGANDRR